MYFRRFTGTKTLEWYGIFVLKSGPVYKTLSEIFCDTYTARKVSKYGVISGPYFPVSGLNTEIYFVNLRI